MGQVDIETFRAWVDAARAARAPSFLSDWHQIRDALRSNFKGTSPQANAFNLARLSVIFHEYVSDPLQPYHDFSWTISDACRDALGDTAQPEQWRMAIELIAAHETVLEKTTMPHESILKVRAQEVEVGRACAILKHHGYALAIDDEARVDMSDAECVKLGQEIDVIARRVGGENVLEAVFHLVDSKRLFDVEQGRWHLTRPGFLFGETAEKAQPPWGYLYNLGLKHIDASGTSSSTEMNKLFELVQAGTTIMCVQSFNAFDGMNIDANKLTQYLIQSVVYDSLFAFSQVDERVATELVSQLATDLESEKVVHEVSLVEAARMGNLILKMADVKYPVILRAKDLSSVLRKSRTNVQKLLDTVYAHTSPANAALCYPPRSTEINASDRPLVWRGEGVYLCPPRAMCAKAVLQSMLDLCDLAVPNVGSQYGPLIERLLINAARAQGLQVKCGKYDLGKVDGHELKGDCDLVIQTEDVVVFLEVKKKGLTKASRSGDVLSDMSLLLDLAQSVAYSQFQALRHESLLRQYKKLVLTSADGTTSEVRWSNQKVLRVSVSLFDMGSLQDRVTLQSFLNLGSRIQVAHPDSALEEATKEVNRLLTKLREQAVAVGELGSSKPFDGSYQLSASHLFVLLGCSSSNESFVEELTRGHRVVNGTRDFYAHRRHMKQLVSVKSGQAQ